MSGSQRRDELEANLAQVRSRIDRACRSAGREPAEVTLIGVTKYFPAADAAMLAELGVADLGESRDQEAAAKVAQVSTLTDAQVRWHFVGRLQTNKARSVAGYAAFVHSVDRLSLAEALGRAVLSSGREPLRVAVQISLDGDVTRGGIAVDGLNELAARIVSTPGLLLGGLMAIAPLSGDADDHFGRLAQLWATLRADYPYATVLSAGMSGDLEAAIRHGATHVRIGTALLGRRSTNVG